MTEFLQINLNKSKQGSNELTKRIWEFTSDFVCLVMELFTPGCRVALLKGGKITADSNSPRVAIIVNKDANAW